VSVFSVGSTGTLVQVPGSPYVTGLSPLAVACSPDGAAGAANVDNTLSVFAVASGVQLTQVPGSPLSLGSEATSVAFSPGGTLLAVARATELEVSSADQLGSLVLRG
jgi:hypothetical protein